MIEERDQARVAVTLAKPSDARRILGSGDAAMREHWERLSDEQRAAIGELREELNARDIGLMMRDDPRFPARLRDLDAGPPFLFYWGNLGLLDEPGVGMCGSRNVSERGLEAARICGEEVAKSGWHIISGYARGVDTETHLAALRTGAATVIVLAEGILHFRRKRIFSDVPFDAEHVLVLSQFRPNAKWNVGAAMNRNAVITALGEAVVVIEAGSSGGTLDAGKRALGLGKEVFALQFGQQTPPGNKILLGMGAKALSSPRQWVDAMARLEPGEHSPTQARIPGAIAGR